MKKHCFILGTRPEIIKMYSCIKFCEKNNIDFFIIHTNQHFSESMDRIFFDELNLPAPKYNLGINGGSHGEMTGKMMGAIEKILIIEKPDIVYVQGDTNTVLAGGLTAAKLDIKVAHIEAGLRSYDRSMPEEINRVCIDHIADFLFAPTLSQREILLSEGIHENKIFTVGNTIVDAVYMVYTKSEEKIHITLDKYSLEGSSYVLLTMHRPSNVDQKEALQQILEAVHEIGKLKKKKVLFPIHPRTRANIIKFGLSGLLDGIQVIEPVGFIENILLQAHADMIITDSGGIQEEGCILQKKILILRDNTERPETLDVGGALLVGNRYDGILDGYKLLEQKMITWSNPFGDGKSAERIFNITNL